MESAHAAGDRLSLQIEVADMTHSSRDEVTCCVGPTRSSRLDCGRSQDEPFFETIEEWRPFRTRRHSLFLSTGSRPMVPGPEEPFVRNPGFSRNLFATPASIPQQAGTKNLNQVPFGSCPWRQHAVPLNVPLKHYGRGTVFRF